MPIKLPNLFKRKRTEKNVLVAQANKEAALKTFSRARLVDGVHSTPATKTARRRAFAGLLESRTKLKNAQRK